MKTKTFLFLVGLILIANLTYSQSVPGPFDANSFSELNDRRTKLNILIPELEGQVYNVSYDRDSATIQSDIEYNEIYINEAIEEMSNSKGDTASRDSSKNGLSFRLKNLNNRKVMLTNELKKSIENNSKKIVIQKTLDSAKSVRNDVEYKINQLMIPKISQQNFMFWASLAFVVLMCILLYTFFKVVNRDEDVRKIIFGSDSGIQFVTLFSIIIAIILFGLTGVLEGKELSALLGSVAGYILGKAKFSNEKTENTKSEALTEDNKSKE